MTTYVLRRLLWMIPSLFVVFTLTFVVVHATPGSPWDESDKPLPEAVKVNLAHQYRLVARDRHRPGDAAVRARLAAHRLFLARAGVVTHRRLGGDLRCALDHPDPCDRQWPRRHPGALHALEPSRGPRAGLHPDRSGE